jgi:hypothetical protein
MKYVRAVWGGYGTCMRERWGGGDLLWAGTVYS